MILLFIVFGTLGFDAIFNSAAERFASGEGIAIFGREVSVGVLLSVVTVLFLIGAAGKSAQIPLYVWLPDAMAGPTPVSALIHAATMVTSGIYLIVRSNVLYEIVREAATQGDVWLHSPNVVAYIGAATALLAGIIAFTQFDIKKMLAARRSASWVSWWLQPGWGLRGGHVHPDHHAFFKALLFLSAGSVILGGTRPSPRRTTPPRGSGFDAGYAQHGRPAPSDADDVLGLPDRRWHAGIFPLAGFWSKDEIWPCQRIQYRRLHLLTGGSWHGILYGAPDQAGLLWRPRRPDGHAEPPLMTVLVILAALAVVGGLLNLPFLTAARQRTTTLKASSWLWKAGWNTLASFGLTEEGLVNLPLLDPASLNYLVAGLSLGLALLAFGLAFYVVYGRRPATAEEPDPFRSIPVLGPVIWWFAILPLNTLYMKFVVPFFNRMAHWLAYTVDWAFWHDFVHDNIIRDLFVGFARFSSSVLDRRGLDGGLVHGAARLARGLASALRVTQTGYVRNYALGLFVGVVALLAYFLLSAG